MLKIPSLVTCRVSTVACCISSTFEENKKNIFASKVDLKVILPPKNERFLMLTGRVLAFV